MKIGIDIDDTTVDLAGVMLKYADIFDTQVLGKSGCNGKFGSIPNRYYLEALYGWTEEEKKSFSSNIIKLSSKSASLSNMWQKLFKAGKRGEMKYFLLQQD